MRWARIVTLGAAGVLATVVFRPEPARAADRPAPGKPAGTDAAVRYSAGETPSWKHQKPIALKGLEVSLSSPLLVARDKGYLWFPSLTRLSSGHLISVMSNYADAHTNSSTALASWSSDRGLTWTRPTAAFYGDSGLSLPSGDLVLLPYYLYPRGEGKLAAPYQVCHARERKLERIQEGLSVSGWPRPDRSFAPELGLAGFVFNGQVVPLKEGGYLATLYGYFKGAARYNLVAAESRDGLQWKIRSLIADENCKLKGSEGPCESATCRLKDGRLMCIFRLASAVPYGQCFSSDDGKTWTEPQAMANAFSVQPSLAVMKDGMLILSGGRPGIFLWFNADGLGKDWQRIDLMAHHNACRPEEAITAAQTSAYTEVVSLDDTQSLCIYDRIPNGWSPIPAGSKETNSVWVVAVKLLTPPPAIR